MPVGQVSRAVDGKGNSIQYRYNSLEKVCERIEQSGDKETFQYDEEGNLSLHTDRDGRQVTRTYNVFGSLVYEKAADENGEGLRHEMKENGKLFRFVYHNGELLHDRYEGGDEEESSYHLGLGIEAVQRNQSIHYYHRDEQLNTAFMTAQNGEIQNHYRYDAFGNLLEDTEKLPNRIRYAGQQYDQAIEQYYITCGQGIIPRHWEDFCMRMSTRETG